MTDEADRSFPAAWLALREAVDHAARDNAATGAARAWAARQASDRPLLIADLGSGSGSNVRYLAPRLRVDQVWRLYDRDAALLELAADDPRLQRRGLTLERRVVDLAGGLPTGALDGVGLVTASALMDLVSEDWLLRLLAQCRAAGAALLVALTYDGRLDWRPALADDRMVHDLFDLHQRRDKGFGPALGPDAAATTARALRDLGYRPVSADSAWRLSAVDRELQAALLDGVAGAAREQAPDAIGRIDAWADRRRGLIDAGRSGLTVGHRDLFAGPP